jgi:antitoxin component YwqK of YwqJK toxin-antitoxin module
MYRLVILFIFCLQIAVSQESTENGYVKLYYPNGKISSEGTMVKGKPDGFWITYYLNGVRKSEGNRRNFLLDSVWVFYDEKGDTTEKINFVLGKRNGYYYKYDVKNVINAGKINYIASKELYVNDKKEGLSYYYHDNGKIKEVLNYKNGKRNGSGREFDQEGKVITLYEFFNDYMIERQYVNRYGNNGLKQGTWLELYDDGKIRSEKIFVNDTLNGYSNEFNERGEVAVSLLYNMGDLKQPERSTPEFSLDEKIDYYPNGMIKRKGFYKGTIPIGIHTFYNENGDIVNARIFNDNGVVASEGFLTEDGKKEGHWKNLYENGEIRSEGIFKNNRQVGEWKFFFNGGVAEQIGNFSNGLFDGEWKWFYKSGKPLREEEYIRGKRDGKYLEFSESGDTIANGHFIEGEMDGEWVLKVGDNLEKGKYVVGLKEGIWREYYNTGVLKSEGNYIQGNPDGKFQIYYENGKLKEEQFYVNGFREKTWRKFNEFGAISLTIAYENDMEKRINGIRIEEIKRN